MKKILPLLFVLSLTMFLISCDQRVFQEFKDIPQYRWARENAITFDVEINDTLQAYDVELAIRHTSYYAFANIKVNVYSTFPSGETRTRDLDLMLRDKDGSFLGEGAGDLWDINFEYLSDFTFPRKGHYLFTVQNIMPLPETPEIMQVGWIVKKSN